MEQSLERDGKNMPRDEVLGGPLWGTLERGGDSLPRSSVAGTLERDGDLPYSRGLDVGPLVGPVHI